MTTPAARFPCLDGYRALAAAAVLVFHVNAATGYGDHRAIGWVLARLDVGVSIFFVLSAFLLSRPFVLAHLRGDPAPRVGQYLTRRAVRIFPAYWLALAGVVVLLDRLELRDGGDVAVFGLLLTGYSVEHLFAGGLFQAWTLTIEVAFYLFLPVYAACVASGGALAARRGGRSGRGEVVVGAGDALATGGVRAARRAVRAQCLGVAVLFAGGLATRTVLTAAEPGQVALLFLPSHLFVFSLGIGLAVASAWAEVTGRPVRGAALAGRHPLACWTLAGLAFWSASTQLGLPRQASWVPMGMGKEMGRHVLFGMTACFVLLPGVFGQQRRGVVRRALASPPLRWLGTVSYGVYLWHYDLVGALTEGARAPDFGITLALAGTASIGIATASYLTLERPLVTLARRVGAGKRAHALRS